jgi:hypothetical protein
MQVTTALAGFSAALINIFLSQMLIGWTIVAAVVRRSGHEKQRWRRSAEVHLRRA